jgi:hypothetical protein
MATNELVTRERRNQALFRVVNERVKELNEAFDALVPLGDWVCECRQRGVLRAVQMSHESTEPCVQAGHDSSSRTPSLVEDHLSLPSQSAASQDPPTPEVGAPDSARVV